MKKMTTFECIELTLAIATIFGVFVSIFVARRQLSKLNDQLFIQYYSDYTKRYQSIILQFPEDINITKFKLKGRKDYEKVMRQMRSYFDLCYEEWFLHKMNKIDQSVWNVWGGGMLSAFSKNAFKQAWEIIIIDTTYEKDFIKFVKQYI
jgi:hypothetical protein